MRESGSREEARGTEKGAGREKSEREVKRCEEQSLLCAAASTFGLKILVPPSSITRIVRSWCEVLFAPMRVCARVGGRLVGWPAGAADAISPKAINRTLAGREICPNWAHRRGRRERIGCVCVAFWKVEEEQMEDVQDMLLAFSLSSQQLCHLDHKKKMPDSSLKMFKQS